MLLWRTFTLILRIRGRNVSVTHSHTRTKIIGVWKIQSCWNFSTFGISVLKVTAGSQCVCVMLQEKQIIQTGKQCRRAALLKTAWADPFCHPLLVSSPLLWLFDELSALNLSKGGLESHHWYIQFNNGCLALGYFTAFFSARRSWCPFEATASIQRWFGHRFFSDPVGSVFEQSQSERGNWNN